MEQVGRTGQGAFRQRQQGDQRRRGGKGSAELRRHFLDPRRQGQGRRHRAAAAAVRQGPQGLSDRRGGAGFRRARSKAPSPTSVAGRSTPRSRRRPATRRRATRPNRSCCCRRPAPPTTSSPISRSAATRFATMWPACWRRRRAGRAVLSCERTAYHSRWLLAKPARSECQKGVGRRPSEDGLMAVLMRGRHRASDGKIEETYMVSRAERSPIADWWWTVDRWLLARRRRADRAAAWSWSWPAARRSPNASASADLPFRQPAGDSCSRRSSS